MRQTLIVSILAAFLASCAIVPAGWDDHRDRNYPDRGYNRDNPHARDHDSTRPGTDSRDDRPRR